jgi:cytosine/adenosine deaminase-related metal-dependent hydrolase
VIVHGVALGSEDLPLFKSCGSSLVWCPNSNLFTLGQTLSTEVLQSGIPVALGSDSALTAGGDLLDEIQTAAHYVNLSRVYDMVTSEAARILRLDAGQGIIREGGIADLLVVRSLHRVPAANLPGLYPELVFLKGKLKLVSASLAKELRLDNLPEFESIEIEGRGKWFVKGRVRSLLATTKAVLGENVCLADRRILT